MPRRGSGRERLPPRALALLAGVAALVAVVVVIAITQLSAGGSHTRVAGAPVASTGSSAGAQPGRHRAGAPAAGGGVDHSTVTVAVLNGTTTPGLAKQVLDQLLKLGFKGGPTANAATQQLAATQVAYATGDRAAARAVAQSLGLPASAVTSADAGVRALAGPGAQVVVTVGGDHATHP